MNAAASSGPAALITQGTSQELWLPVTPPTWAGWGCLWPPVGTLPSSSKCKVPELPDKLQDSLNLNFR